MSEIVDLQDYIGNLEDVAVDAGYDLEKDMGLSKRVQRQIDGLGNGDC